MARFKIDFNDSSRYPFVLFYAKPKWHTRITGAVSWNRITSEETREPILEFYEKIKDLPQYLD